MKFLFGFLLMMAFISCKKNNLFLNADVVGKWELASSTNFAGYFTYAPGNNNIIEFTANSKYVYSDSTGLQLNGIYNCYYRKDCNADKKRPFVNFSGEIADKFFATENEKLVFSFSNCVSDGVVTTYRRIQ